MTQQYLTPSSHEKLAKAAAGPLSRLTSQTHVSLNKKINTILQIVLHELAGQAWHNDTFWKRPDTCSESIFYKWKRDDPDFTPILDEGRAARHLLGWHAGFGAVLAFGRGARILQEVGGAAAVVERACGGGAGRCCATGSGRWASGGCRGRGRFRAATVGPVLVRLTLRPSERLFALQLPELASVGRWLPGSVGGIIAGDSAR